MGNGGDKTGNFVPGVGERRTRTDTHGAEKVAQWKDYWLLFHKSRVWFPARIWQLTIICNFLGDPSPSSLLCGCCRPVACRHIQGQHPYTENNNLKKGLAACWPQKQMTDKASWKGGREFSLELENPLQATPSSPPDTTLPQDSTSFLAPESWKPPYIFWNRRFPFQGTPEELLP